MFIKTTSSKLLDMVDSGELDAKDVLLAALKYMSEDDVLEMIKRNEFITNKDCNDKCIENFDNIIDRDPEW